MTVTDKRIVTGNTTYALANITSCKTDTSLHTDGDKAILQKLVVVVSLALGLYAWWAFHYGLGIAVAVVGTGGALNIQVDYLVYRIQLGASSGEIEALSSRDRSFIEKVVQAINDAIVARA